ncbi:MAG TPA: lysozyme inhibitor LprI family protein [Candidatus Binatia bacterium]|nr:lysozyme inhibitor LprI family protein [Candidatus Binatia bacterium]
MMRITMLAGALLLAVAAGVCAQSQRDMDQTAGTDLGTADKELNGVFQEILKKYADDPAFITKLRAAQRAWIALRDAELAASYPHAEPGYYGSVYPTCAANRLAELTRARTNDLRRWLVGTEEGDVCAGALKTK